jgi:predicted DNA-binding transcriptional regulator AlpA
MELDRIIREPERRKVTGVSRATWWRWERKDLVPKRRAIGPNVTGWSARELAQWMESRGLPSRPGSPHERAPRHA